MYVPLSDVTSVYFTGVVYNNLAGLINSLKEKSSAVNFTTLRSEKIIYVYMYLQSLF